MRRRARHLLQRLRSVTLGEALQSLQMRVVRRARWQIARRRDARRPTWLERPPPSGRWCLPEAPAPRVPDDEPWLDELAGRHLDHRFDLLGSGWVRVEHGMACAGLEGRRFPSAAPVQADADGAWLAHRVTPANLPEAQRVWRLIDDPDYTPIDWQLDFRSGYRWSELSWYGDIPRRGPEGSDVKVPWELGRMQHLPLLARAAAAARYDRPGLQPPERYLSEFRCQVLDFIATNPPRFGVQWACAMDVALRAVSWITAWDLFLAAGLAVDDAFDTLLRRSLCEHARHIVENLEGSNTHRGNHYLADVTGLLFIGASLPRDPEVDVWLAFAAQELPREILLQFHPDGGNTEASVAYHRLSGEMAVHGSALLLGLPEEKRRALEDYDARLHRGRFPLTPAPASLRVRAGDAPPSPLGDEHVERLQRSLEFLADVTKPDGRIPQIGDNDSGRLLKLRPALRAGIGPGEPWEEDLDARHLLAAGAGLFPRADFEAGGRGFQIETSQISRLARGARLRPTREASAARLDMGAAARRLEASLPERFGSVELVLPAPGPSLREGIALFAYPDFGLYLFRSPRLYLAVRCGGASHRSNSHAHADQLAVELTIDGEDRIADPGSYVYTPLPEQRNLYRSAAAHFVPHVPGREPVDLSRGLFWFLDETSPECLHFGPEGFVGRHRGYGVPVVREVRVEEDRVIVRDGFTEASDLGLEPPGVSRPVPWSPGYGRRRGPDGGAV